MGIQLAMCFLGEKQVDKQHTFGDLAQPRQPTSRRAQCINVGDCSNECDRDGPDDDQEDGQAPANEIADAALRRGLGSVGPNNILQRRTWISEQAQMYGRYRQNAPRGRPQYQI